MAKQDGGPAFPRAAFGAIAAAETYNAEQEGMSLRDWFAGMALPTVISLTQHSDGVWDSVAVSACAYAVADAMLAARGM